MERIEGQLKAKNAEIHQDRGELPKDRGSLQRDGRELRIRCS